MICFIPIILNKMKNLIITILPIILMSCNVIDNDKKYRDNIAEYVYVEKADDKDGWYIYNDAKYTIDKVIVQFTIKTQKTVDYIVPSGEPFGSTPIEKIYEPQIYEVKIEKTFIKGYDKTFIGRNDVLDLTDYTIFYLEDIKSFTFNINYIKCSALNIE